MDSLLAEMRDLESRGAGPVRSAPISQLAIEGDVQEWAQQYLESGKSFQVIFKDLSDLITYTSVKFLDCFKT